jgi:hypothetical protein
MAGRPHPQPHPDPSIAYHFDWDFRREAAIWHGGRTVGVNFHPIATELRDWLLRQGVFSILREDDKGGWDSFTNPYAYHASVLACILARTVEAGHDFVTADYALDEVDAEVERIRLYNEHVLYTARFCEASIKQLLYCTQIPSRYYEQAALGELLSSECKACKRAGRVRHKISMLGSLAHRYHLCIPFEHCLFEHLKIVNRRRNVEAAHAETQSLRMRPIADARARLHSDSHSILQELVHMLQHVSELEQRMLNELNGRTAADYSASA